MNETEILDFGPSNSIASYQFDATEPVETYQEESVSKFGLDLPFLANRLHRFLHFIDINYRVHFERDVPLVHLSLLRFEKFLYLLYLAVRGHPDFPPPAELVPPADVAFIWHSMCIRHENFHALAACLLTHFQSSPHPVFPRRPASEPSSAHSDPSSSSSPSAASVAGIDPPFLEDIIMIPWRPCLLPATLDIRALPFLFLPKLDPNAAALDENSSSPLNEKLSSPLNENSPSPLNENATSTLNESNPSSTLNETSASTMTGNSSSLDPESQPTRLASDALDATHKAQEQQTRLLWASHARSFDLLLLDRLRAAHTDFSGFSLLLQFDEQHTASLSPRLPEVLLAYDWSHELSAPLVQQRSWASIPYLLGIRHKRRLAVLDHLESYSARLRLFANEASLHDPRAQEISLVPGLTLRDAGVPRRLTFTLTDNSNLTLVLPSDEEAEGWMRSLLAPSQLHSQDLRVVNFCISDLRWLRTLPPAPLSASYQKYTRWLGTLVAASLSNNYFQGPPADVDLFWHVHMMNPRDYIRYCSEHGNLYWHFPASDVSSKRYGCCICL